MKKRHHRPFAWRMTTMALITLTSIAPTTAATPDISATGLGLHLKPCVQGHTKAKALCGTFGVYENRETQSGRIIELGVIVLKAKHPNGDAIANVEGGPGVPSMPDAPFMADGDFPMIKPFLRTTDVIFVDNRGMGVSNPTKCDIAPSTDMPAYYAQIWPTKILSKCYATYSKTNDASAYNTNNAVDDLDDVRAALGYHRITLFGGSYGSFFALVYIRRHETSVKNAVLLGIAAPGFQPLPGAPAGAQRALDDLAEKCNADRVCRSHFPKFTEHFAAVVRRFNNGPVAIEVWNPNLKRRISVRLSKEVFVDRVRESLYEPEIAAFLPFAIERAYNYDYISLGKIIDQWSQFLAQGQDAGTNLAYRCAEFDPFISSTELHNQALHSFTGDLRVQAERQACAIWKVDPMPASFDDPVRSNVPILMLEGSDDPATPPESAEGAVKTLPNAKLLLVRGAGHGVFTRCAVDAMIQLIRNGSAASIQASSCNDSFKAPPFQTSMAKWNT
jgi:pimeloyl-ACP methyl ester carboxylesterase